jgi:hypothetical protein
MMPTLAQAEPRIKHVTLTKETTLVIELVPDLGTRFVFPFVLDEQDEYVPFTSTLTNPAFASIREPGRNSFVLTIPPPVTGGPSPVLFSSLFVSVAGYEISVELRVTHDLARHYSDIVFDISDEVRESLIQKAVKQRTASLERDYKEREAAMNKAIERRALSLVGKLALTGAQSSAVKEEGALVFEGTDRLLLYVEKAVRYGPFTSFVFALENKSHSAVVSVMEARLFVIDPRTGQSRPLETAAELPPRVNPRSDAQGILSIESALLPADRKARLQISVDTDKGVVKAQW